MRAIIDRRNQPAQRGDSQISIDRIRFVIEMANVNGHVSDANVAQVERGQVPVNDFKTTTAANRARQPAVSHGSNAQFARRLF